MPTTIITNKQCSDLGDQYREKINGFFDERIKPLQDDISADVAAGKDPTLHRIIFGAITLIIDLPLLIEEINVARGHALEGADAQVVACDTVAVPNFVGDAQKVLDIAIGLAALPFLILTKNYASANIDLGQVYQGKPLGGPNALVPKMRGDVLDFFNVGGDVRKFIEDPFEPINITIEKMSTEFNKKTEEIKSGLNDFLGSLGIGIRL